MHSPELLQSAKGLHREHIASPFQLPRTMNRQNSETPSLEGTKSSSPTISTGTSASLTTTIQTPDVAEPPITTSSDWAHLNKDIQYHLGYYCKNITYYSYGIPNDPDGFFSSTLLSLAIREGNEALLYAIVGFSAYHSTLRHPHGKVEDFLGYYNRSVNNLLSSFKRGDGHGLANLLTMLQLATIEVRAIAPGRYQCQC